MSVPPSTGTNAADTFGVPDHPNDHVKNTFVHYDLSGTDNNFDVTPRGSQTCPSGQGGSTPLARSASYSYPSNVAVAACFPASVFSQRSLVQNVAFLAERDSVGSLSTSAPLLEVGFPLEGLDLEVCGPPTTEGVWHGPPPGESTAPLGHRGLELNKGQAIATPKEPPPGSFALGLSDAAMGYQHVGADEDPSPISPDSPVTPRGTDEHGRQGRAAATKKKPLSQPQLLLPIAPRAVQEIEPLSGAAPAASSMAMAEGAHRAEVIGTASNAAGGQIMKFASCMSGRVTIGEFEGQPAAPAPAVAAAVAAPPPTEEEGEGSEGWRQQAKNMITPDKQKQPKGRGPAMSSAAPFATTTTAHSAAGGRDYEYTKYLCRFPVQVKPEVEGGFHVCRRIFGPDGQNMKKIVGITNAKLRLRGIGSGYKEVPDNEEANCPLELNISAEDHAGYRKAIRMVTELLERVYGQYNAHCARIGLSEDRYPRNLTVRLEEHPGNPTG